MIGLSRATHAKSKSPEAREERLVALVAFLDPKTVDTAELERRLGASIIADIAELCADLITSERSRVSARLRIGDGPWELGFERIGDGLSASVFAGGAIPTVLTEGRRLEFPALRERLLLAIERVSDGLPDGVGARLRHAKAALESVTGLPVVSEAELLVVEPATELSFGLSAELMVRAQPSSPNASSVLRADLLPLLGKGKLRINAFDHTRELDGVHVFLLIEQLARLTLEALEAHSVGRSLWRKLQIGGAVCGIRLVPRREAANDGGTSDVASVTLGKVAETVGGRADSWTFPLVDLASFAEGVVSFGRALARSLVRRDRSLSHNLRLVDFRAKLREISEVVRDQNQADSIVNRAPESYRAFAAITAKNDGADVSRARLRYELAWQAAVPSIDLRSTFLTGDGILVGSSREMCCIHRRSGEIVWRKPAQRAVSVLTPCGLARFDAEGTLRLHDVETGEVRWTLRLSPRVGAPVTGAVVSAPSLPRMLILSEGKRHVTGIDLDSGDVRWRYAARRAGTFRLRRAGKIVIIASGEQALTALDVVTGEVVWRVCDSLRFASPCTVEKDSLFAIAGDGAFPGRGGSRLSHVDPWSGEKRWSVELPAHAKPVGSPLSCSDSVVVVTHGGLGTGLVGFDARSGEKLFEREACLGAAASLSIDRTVILNSEAGELVALDSRTGSVRYRHIFSEGNDGDRPRRLDPVLRSGALFVPQSSVQVLRPQDGAVLGTVQTDLIPDLVRVDERCDVFVAEESGHISAFAVGPKLSLVR